VPSTSGVWFRSEALWFYRAFLTAGLSTRRRFVIRRRLTAKPCSKNIGKDTKPPAGQPIRQTAEGFDHRFLWSQSRVIGLNRSAGRYPGGANSTITRIKKACNSATTETTHIAPCKCTPSQGETITSQAIRRGRFYSTRPGN